MLMTSSAPAAAWAAIGPCGFQASSQMETPTRTPPMPNSWVAPPPGGEVALLVEDAVVGKLLLVIDAADLARGAHRGGVVQVELLVDEADHGDAALGGRGHLGQGGQVVGHEPGLQQQVLGRVAGDRQLREDGHVGAGLLGDAEGRDDPLGVAAQVADDRIELAERHAQAGHHSRAYARPAGVTKITENRYDTVAYLGRYGRSHVAPWP